MDFDEIKNKRLKADPQVAARIIDSQVFAVTPSNWQLHRFNEVASLIWEMAEQERTVAEVVRAVTDGFEVDPDVARNDCVAFVELLQESGLAQLSDE